MEHGSGAAIIHGFDIQPYSIDQLKIAFAVITSHIGTAVSQSARGELIFSVRNEGYAEHDPRSRGPNSGRRLSFHTDRCDVIAFLCVNQAKSGGENQIVSSVAVFHEIAKSRPDLLKVLMQPFYYKRHNVDFGNDKPYIQQPVFSIHQGHFAANILRILIDRAYAMPDLPNMTDAQREALDLVEEISNRPSFHASLRLAPGDMLILNNFVTFHRRSEFKDYDTPERPTPLPSSVAFRPQ